jgi:hypothetical protein
MALGRQAVVVIVGASAAIAAVAVYPLTPWGSTVPAPAKVTPLASAADAGVSVAAAGPSATGSEGQPTESLEPLDSLLESPLESTTESTTEPPPPADSTPPCPRYYPACGKFSRPGVVADEDCGCRPDEACSRTGATGWCVRKPRWLGPQN